MAQSTSELTLLRCFEGSTPPYRSLTSQREKRPGFLDLMGCLTGNRIVQEQVWVYMCCFLATCRSLLSGAELARVRDALESDDGILQHSFGRSGGHGRSSRLCLWNHPGNDITGMVGRCEKVAGTTEQVCVLVCVRVCIMCVCVCVRVLQYVCTRAR